MSSKITVERILRDADDASGQTIREWKLELEGKTLTISGSRHRPDSVSYTHLTLPTKRIV